MIKDHSDVDVERGVRTDASPSWPHEELLRPAESPATPKRVCVVLAGVLAITGTAVLMVKETIRQLKGDASPLHEHDPSYTQAIQYSNTKNHAALIAYVDSHPPRTKMLMLKVESLRALGDKEGELATLSQIVSLDPDRVHSMRLLAAAYERHGRLPEALAWYRKAVERNPKTVQEDFDRDSIIRFDLIRLLRQHGMHDEAVGFERGLPPVLNEENPAKVAQRN